MPKKAIYGILIVLALITLGFSATSLWEDVNAGEIVVIQMPYTGELKVITTAGTYGQYFGTVTRYKKSFQYWFRAPKKGEDGPDESIKISFNDRGHAQINGSIRVDMPADNKSLVSLHTKFGSQEAIEKALIGQIVAKAIYNAGPMMSSKESNAERRNELLQLIEDQAVNGVYLTKTITAKIKDPMDEKQERTVSIVTPATDQKGIPIRAEQSQAKEFNLRLYNLTLNTIDYDGEVEKQFKQQQNLTMQVQTAIAEAKTAEQQAFTVMKQGEAAAAKAKWEQEALNSQIVAEAEGKRRAAEEDAKTALAEKAANIARGQGIAERKRLEMAANNALDAKLEYGLKVNTIWANAFKDHEGALVPQVWYGGGSPGNAGINLMELFSAKIARDFAIDLKTK